ncbi:MAG: hypothetical protein JNK14_17695 [Chitinophagaceae bacterium]|nr:hypothetical protein [Chitinophagaceae bacterium]
MKYIVIAAIILVMPSFLCNKEKDNDGLCAVNLLIVSAQTPATVPAGSDITALVKCSGSDLCYSYTHTDIKNVSPRIYEIRTMGTYPCKPAICAQAIYYAEPSVRINTTQTGQYILRYYNGNTLFRADTVTVN